MSAWTMWTWLVARAALIDQSKEKAGSGFCCHLRKLLSKLQHISVCLMYKFPPDLLTSGVASFSAPLFYPSPLFPWMTKSLSLHGERLGPQLLAPLVFPILWGPSGASLWWFTSSLPCSFIRFFKWRLDQCLDFMALAIRLRRQPLICCKSVN